MPANYDGAFHGPVRLRDALANSYNIPAVLLLQDIGVPRLLEFGRALGLDSWTGDSSQYGLSLTLGGGAGTPLELTTAYAGLAKGCLLYTSDASDERSSGSLGGRRII